jgi:iron complex transport system substrate-binding protein
VRIVSLLPSATEIVASLGLLDSLVGRSEECDWPPQVRAVPVVTASRFDTRELNGKAIDDAVRRAVAAGTSLYAVDETLVESLRPDVILTQDLCRVCAVSSSEVCDVGAEVISLDPHTLADIADTVQHLGDRLGAATSAGDLKRQMLSRIDLVRRHVADLPRPRVFVAEWLDPPFAAGHWLPEMVEAAGGHEVLGRAGEASRPTTWEEVAAAAPELVVLAPCGWDAERAAREAESLELPWPSVVVDGNAFFSRPAPRVAEGVELLARLFHPEAFASS